MGVRRGWDSRSSAGFRLRWTRVFADAWRRHPPVGVTGEVHEMYRESRKVGDGRKISVPQWQLEGSRTCWQLHRTNTERIRCVSVASVRAVSVCRSTAIAAVRGTLSRRRSRAARTGPAGRRGGRPHSAVKVRYGFRATYYGTTATGKKCTVSRFGCEVHLRDPCVPCVPCVSRFPLKFLKRRRDEPAGHE